MSFIPFSSLVLVFLASILASTTAQAGSTDLALGKAVSLESPATVALEDPWDVKLRINAWTTSLEGNIGAGGLVVPVDISFNDILDNLNFVWASTLTARKGQWGVIVDTTYLEIGPPVPSVPVPLFSVDSLVIEQFLGAALISYRIHASKKNYVELLAGMQYTWTRNELSLSAGPTAGPISRTVSGSNGWVDPVVGVRGLHYFNKRLYGIGYASIGGFGVSSDLTWTAGGGLGYEVNDRIAIEALYRYLSIDYDRKILFDADMGGPFLGVRISF